MKDDYMLKDSDFRTFTQRMDEFSRMVHRLVLKKYDHVASVFDAEKLVGFTLAEVKARLMKIVTDHTSKMNVNIHSITPDMLDTFSKDLIEKYVNELLETNDGIPLSFYDVQNFLPFPATTTFENITQIEPYVSTVMHIEDDGDLSILMNGTNGKVLGVFYGRMPNANGGWTREASPTTLRYLPPRLNEKIVPLTIQGGNSSVVMGYSGAVDSSVPEGWWVCLTGGTLDFSKHVASLIPFSVMRKFDDIHPVIVGTDVYFLMYISVAEIEVWSTSIASIQAGTANPVRVTGWKNRFSASEVVTDDNILFTRRGETLWTQAGKSFTAHAQGWGRSTCLSETKLNGITDVRILRNIQCTPEDSLVGHPVFLATVDFTINPGKNLDFTKYNGVKPVINYVNLSMTAEQKGAFEGKIPFQDILPSQGHNTIFYGRQRGFCLFSRGVDGVMVLYSVDYEAKDREAVKNGANLFRNRAHVPLVRGLQTPVGTNISVVSVTSDRMLVSSTAGVSEFGYNPAGRIEMIGLGNRKIEGFPLNIDRISRPDLRNAFLTSVSEVNVPQGKTLAHNMSFSSKPSLIPTSPSSLLAASRPESTWNDGIQNSITNALRSLVSASYPNLKDLIWTIVKPQICGLPPFVHFSFLVGTTEARLVLYNGIVSVTLGGTNLSITSATLVAASVRYSPAVTDEVIRSIDPNARQYTDSIAIRETSDGYVVALSVGGIYHIGNTISSYDIWTYKGGSFNNVDTGSHGYPGTLSFYNHLTNGLQYVTSSPLDASAASIDAGTKAVGRIISTTTTATNPIDINIKNTKPTDLVIATSELPTEWVLYFPEEVDAMMDGIYKKVDRYSYKLNPTTDKWKVFHVWLKNHNGKFIYVIDKTEYDLNLMPLSLNRENHLYLGYFTTNGFGVKSIRLDKAISIGGYRLSEWASGKSIPVSAGFPQENTKLNWV